MIVAAINIALVCNANFVESFCCWLLPKTAPVRIPLVMKSPLLVEKDVALIAAMIPHMIKLQRYCCGLD